MTAVNKPNGAAGIPPEIERAVSHQIGEVLSPSQVNNLRDCAYRWYCASVLKLPDPQTGALALGKAIHSAILKGNMEQKIQSFRDLPVSGVVALFRDAWAMEQVRTEFRDDENPSELRAAGEALVRLYMDEIAPTIQPAAVEMPVSGVLVGIRVQGIIDLLDISGRVIDLKSSKTSPSGIEPSHRFQVATYRHLTPGATGKARIDTLVKTKSPKLVQQSFDVTEQDLREPHTIYPLAQEIMRNELFIANRRSMTCSRRNCAFWRRCEAEFGGTVPET